MTGDGFGTVYVVANNLLRRTRNFGAVSVTWVDITPAGGATLYDLILDPWGPATTGYISSTAGIYKSTNLDLDTPTWSLILSKATIEAALSAVADTFRKAHKIVASINYEGYVGFAFMARRTDRELWFARSLDGGSSWSYSLITAFPSVPGFDLGFAGYAGGLDIVPRVIGGDLRLYLAFTIDDPAEARLYRSDDKGATWAVKSTTTKPAITGGVCVHTPYNGNLAGNIVYWSHTADNDVQAAYYSTDGGVTPITLDFPASGATDDEKGTIVKRTGIESYTQNRLLMYAWQAATNKLLSSDDGGATWSEVTIATAFTGTPVASGGFPFDDQLYYLVTSSLTDAGIFVSVDGGANWVEKTGDWASFAADLYNAVIVPLWTAE
jgi:hypothetical protein